MGQKSVKNHKKASVVSVLNRWLEKKHDPDGSNINFAQCIEEKLETKCDLREKNDFGQSCQFLMEMF